MGANEPKNHPSGLTTKEIDDLYHRAQQAAENAYTPYSRFRVGAALLLDNGEIVTGCNVENASYRLTVCAEQNAVTTAVAQYGPGIRIRAVAIANLNNTGGPPCGACRQTILEFSTPGTWVFYPTASEGLVEASIADLIPSGFTLEH